MRSSLNGSGPRRSETADLDEIDKAVISGRVATHLAAAGRERLARSGWTDDDLEDVPEQEEA